jgi:hypothetical protein
MKKKPKKKSIDVSVRTFLFSCTTIPVIVLIESNRKVHHRLGLKEMLNDSCIHIHINFFSFSLYEQIKFAWDF